jgi:ferredoxin
MGKRGDWTREELVKEFEGMSGRTVPVDIRIEATQKILCLDEVEQILRDARRIVVGECECRAKMQRCDKSLEVCLFLDEGADKQIELGTGKEITLSEALSVLERTYREGLVHVSLAEKEATPVQYVCSCCACCCQAIAVMQKFGYHEVLVFSNMIMTHSPESCDDCGACVSRCNFGALTMEDDRLRFESRKCFGCGVCVASCPRGALSPSPRS